MFAPARGSFCLSEVTSSIFFGPKACRSWWVGNTETKRQREKKVRFLSLFSVEATTLQWSRKAWRQPGISYVLCSIRCTGSLEITQCLVEHFGFSVLLQTESEVFQAGHPLKTTPHVLLFTLFLNGLNDISDEVSSVFSQYLLNCVCIFHLQKQGFLYVIWRNYLMRALIHGHFN